MSDITPALTTSDEPGTVHQNNEDSCSGWGLKSLADKIWNSEATAAKDKGSSGAVKSAFPTPFAGLFSSNQETPAAEASKQQQGSSSSTSSQHTVDAHAAVDEATQTDPEDSDKEHDSLASTDNESDHEIDSEDEWEDTDEDDPLPSLSDLLARCWYGTSPDANSSSPKPQQHDRRRLLKPSTSLNRSRQLSLTRKKADTSWTPSWVPKAFTKPTLLSRSASWRSKPLKVKVAEQVLGEGLVAAIDLVQRDILESGEPLPEATIKFFVKAAAGVATGWAHSNLNRVFMAFGGYVAATCGAMHFTKKAAKWLAWKVPWGGRRAVGPAVTFAADVLLPTQFFGPWLATYVVCRVVVQERHRIRAAATAAAAAEKVGADKEAVVTAAIGAALHPDSGQEQQEHEEEKEQQQVKRQQQQQQQKEQQHKEQEHKEQQQQQQQQQNPGHRQHQRAGSLSTRQSGGLRTGLKAKRKALPGRPKPRPAQVPVTALPTQPSGDVWGIKDP